MAVDKNPQHITRKKALIRNADRYAQFFIKLSFALQTGAH
jgi:hypothetical protein